MTPHPEHRLARLLALNRTVAVVLLSVLLFGLGQQLWHPFVPLYLKDQTKDVARAATATGNVGATALWLVGIYAMCFNLFEAFCSLGGSHLTARLGDRGSLLTFGTLTILGYLLFLLVPLPWATVVATVLILSWEPLSVPVTFTTVGSTVAEGSQGMAFALQSIQKRLPKILGPLIAGWVLQTLQDQYGDVDGRQRGMLMLVGVALLLAAASLWTQWRWLPHRPPPPPPTPWNEVYGRYPPRIRRLLLAEIFTRWCDWLVREFLFLYLYLVRGVPARYIGLLIAVQNLTALLTYLPVGRMTRTVGLRPFIGLTFVFFALFPLVLALVPGGGWLVLAYVVYGLREIGEPARKALITSLMPEDVRARGVGLYWGLRSFAICPAALAGAAVWHHFGPQVLLLTASATGSVGAAIYYLLGREPRPLAA
jgi:MFS family permease